MAKRFTDTNKWDQAWFRKLSPKMKCAWSFLCDKCDHAGVWETDLETMSHFIGDDISIFEIEESFNEKVEIISADKIIIRAFIDFQYGTLNPDNRVHQSVISRLEKLAPTKGLISPLKGAKDKDKEKDKDKVKEKKKKIEEIYAAHYPLKKGKSKGVDKLAADISTEADLSSLVAAIERYKSTITKPEFTKHFSTFASEWRDWLDPDAGKVEGVKSKDMDVSHIFGGAK